MERLVCLEGEPGLRHSELTLSTLMLKPWFPKDPDCEYRGGGSGSEGVKLPPPPPQLESPGLGHFVLNSHIHTRFLAPLAHHRPPPRGKHIRLHGNCVVSRLTRPE